MIACNQAFGRFVYNGKQVLRFHARFPSAEVPMKLSRVALVTVAVPQPAVRGLGLAAHRRFRLRQ